MLIDKIRQEYPNPKPASRRAWRKGGYCVLGACLKHAGQYEVISQDGIMPFPSPWQFCHEFSLLGESLNFQNMATIASELNDTGQFSAAWNALESILQRLPVDSLLIQSLNR